ncbi:MAG: hypothetical protein KJN96_06845, partial [Eudoraea sp.]|nr:hypothetical protein [Eudoraea sp.]
TKPIMDQGLSLKRRLLFTGIVTLLVWAHLLWDYLHEGVPTHYLLHSKDMPGISNWWGGITLPLVTFLLLFWIHKNFLKTSELDISETSKILVIRFIMALVFGILLSVFFTLGSPAPGYMMLIAIVLSFFLPLYKPEYLLGLILGMSYTFGANLPILVAFVLLLIFLVSYKLIRFGALVLIARMRSS